VRTLLGLVTVLALAGCGGSGGSKHHVSLPKLTPVSSVCGNPPSGIELTASWLVTSDGQPIYSVTGGSGDSTVVLAHESGGIGLCGWYPTIQLLVAHGFRVLAFDFRGIYPSPLSPRATENDWGRDIFAAVAAAKAKHVFLMGASFGGAASMEYAPDVKGLDGLINLSGELRLPASHIDAIDNVSKLRVPFLVVASRSDAYLDAEDARKLIDRAGSSDKQLALYRGRAHGWDILAEQPTARRLLLRWLTQRSQ
jgi:alpha-beta hydrolase superfamily lysophospholipase